MATNAFLYALDKRGHCTHAKGFVGVEETTHEVKIHLRGAVIARAVQVPAVGEDLEDVVEGLWGVFALAVAEKEGEHVGVYEWVYTAALGVKVAL